MDKYIIIKYNLDINSIKNLILRNIQDDKIYEIVDNLIDCLRVGDLDILNEEFDFTFFSKCSLDNYINECIVQFSKYINK